MCLSDLCEGIIVLLLQSQCDDTTSLDVCHAITLSSVLLKLQEGVVLCMNKD